MNSNNKKLILSFLICSFSYNLSGNDWVKNYVLKLGSGAFLGGFGAVMSGFSVPMATLGALAGSWISNAWQSNNQLLDALQQANKKTEQAISSLGETENVQKSINDSLQKIEVDNLSINADLARANNNLTQAGNKLRACLRIGDGCRDSLLVVNQNIDVSKVRIDEINNGLFRVLGSQEKYEQEFAKFVIQNQRRTAQLSVLALFQQRQVTHILQQQDILQDKLNQGLNVLNKAKDRAREFTVQQEVICEDFKKLQSDCNKNLDKQKQLERELAQMLESKRDGCDFTIGGIVRSMIANPVKP